MNNLIYNDNYKFWLGGFIEGEGSLTISVVKSDKAPLAVYLQPEFNVSQHINGIKILNTLLYIQVNIIMMNLINL